MRLYDGENGFVDFKLPNFTISKIAVTLINGDENVVVYFSNRPPCRYNAHILATDSYYDGSYSISGKMQIQKWLNWQPTNVRNCYSLERRFAFSHES